MNLADDLSGLELKPKEYVCEVCHLVHWGPAGPAACDLR